MNSRDLREKLNEKRQSKIQSRGCELVESSADSASLEAKLRKLNKRINDIEKTPVGLYIEEIEPHFTKDILDAAFPSKIKMPQKKFYEGEGDLTE